MAKKPGKYAKVVGKLARYEGGGGGDEDDETQGGDYAARVRDVKAELLKEGGGAIPTDVLIRAWYAQRTTKEQLTEELKDVNLHLAALGGLLSDAMEFEDTTKIKLSDGMGVELRHEPRAVVKDREKFRQWCIAQGMEKELHLAWGTTNSMTKDMLLKGLNEPDGVEAFHDVKLRKG